MPRLPGLALLLLCCIAAPALADEDGPIRLSPQQIGDIFCIARLGNDMAPAEALVTPALHRAIAAARRQDQAWSKAHPGDKPPLGDGLPWQDAPDYAPACKAVAGSVDGERAKVGIAYAFPDAPAADFTDELQLRRVPDAAAGDTVWRIDDIVLAGGGSMRARMIEAFKP